MAAEPQAPSEPSVILEERDGVATVTLNRPDRGNALTSEMQDRYFDALEEADARESVRAIVITGAGRAFCVGADMAALGTLAAGGADEAARAIVARSEVGRNHLLPVQLRKPVVAAVNGSCAGLGLVMALACDVRFVAAEAKLTTAFSHRGLVAEHGSAWILPRLIGTSAALDVLLSSRILTGREAAAMGMASAALPAEQVLDHAVAYARDLACNASPTAMAAIKEQVYAAYQLGPAEAYTESLDRMLESFGWPDVTEGVASFVEKRAPRFPPLPSSGPSG